MGIESTVIPKDMQEKPDLEKTLPMGKLNITENPKVKKHIGLFSYSQDINNIVKSLANSAIDRAEETFLKTGENAEQRIEVVIGGREMTFKQLREYLRLAAIEGEEKE